jgi:hypothetical protein
VLGEADLRTSIVGTAPWATYGAGHRKWACNPTFCPDAGLEEPPVAC